MMANKIETATIILISLILGLELTLHASAASFSLTRGALLRSDRATGMAANRFDPHSKWGRYWINTINQGNKAPMYGSYGKRAFFEGFYYPYYANSDGGNSRPTSSDLVLLQPE